jgi:hypothetical protein
MMFGRFAPGHYLSFLLTVYALTFKIFQSFSKALLIHVTFLKIQFSLGAKRVLVRRVRAMCFYI